ncbi:shikimate kinase i [hydrocarbon metagenome]|uniref:shikimate kinase n=1 Tax=hydrocarbon metagenome TaxID=938273 RepID=A0A0W8FTG7_9ZZZZ
MNIVLIGYRATGKSTVGRILSRKLKMSFWDTDLLVEKKMAIPIKEIVALHGWEYFRLKEKEVIQTMAQRESGIVSTGGGVVLDQGNVNLLKQTGVIIWLNAPVQDIVDRLNKDAQSRATRPQFTAGNIAQETIAIMEQRFPLYEEAADYTVNTKDKKALQVAEEIYQYLLKSGNLSKINKSKKTNAKNIKSC